MQAAVQVDLDCIWTYQRYLKTRGPEYVFDPVYKDGVPFFLELFRKYGIKATFFVVARDLKIPEHEKIAKTILDAGHEIANHTYSHPLNFSKLSKDDLLKEIILADECLKQLFPNADIKGFRAPTFSIDERAIRILKEKSYKYDASVIPSLLIPLILKLGHSLLKGRIVNFDTGSTGFFRVPLSVYQLSEKDICENSNEGFFEVPITVIPGLRLPIHSTYVFIFGKWYFKLGLNAIIRKKMHISYLFHGIDPLNLDGYGIKIPFIGNFVKRREICEYIIKQLSKKFNTSTTKDVVETMESENDLHITSGLQ
ncbi:MAG: polysaccharide deacetylase family protein [Candidatus Omnitrophica bacterium]|nr:polysaccharide deacetylase family protein [Candidatus Omnitrophota bacterium]